MCQTIESRGNTRGDEFAYAELSTLGMMINDPGPYDSIGASGDKFDVEPERHQLVIFPTGVLPFKWDVDKLVRYRSNSTEDKKDTW